MNNKFALIGRFLLAKNYLSKVQSSDLRSIRYTLRKRNAYNIIGMRSDRIIFVFTKKKNLRIN